MLPLSRCSFALRHGSLAPLRTKQCLPRSFSQSFVVAKAAVRPAQEELLAAWDKCL